MSYAERLRLYEEEKRKLVNSCLTQLEFEREIMKLVKKHKI